MRNLTLTEDEATQLKEGDPLDYHNGDEWVPATVVRQMTPEHDTVRVATGDLETEAELGELRG